tara:strand:+ start:1114 stop:1326 length:213 start_codon:yes stop_codon:yes gene_type:complete
MLFDEEINRIVTEVGSHKKTYQLAKADHKIVRFYLPIVQDHPEQPIWPVIRQFFARDNPKNSIPDERIPI